MINKEMMTKVRDAIKLDADLHYDQTEWGFMKTDQIDLSCQTPGCIAAYTLFMNNGERPLNLAKLLEVKPGTMNPNDPNYIFDNYSKAINYVETKAAELLGLTPHQAATLFAGGWPEDWFYEGHLDDTDPLPLTDEEGDDLYADYHPDYYDAATVLTHIIEYGMEE